MTYTITLSKLILEDSNEGAKYASLRYELSLPFVPFIGLSLGEKNWSSGTIKSVYFDNATLKFSCHVENEYANDDVDDDYTPDSYFDHLVERAVSEGWKLIVIRDPNE